MPRVSSIAAVSCSAVLAFLLITPREQAFAVDMSDLTAKIGSNPKPALSPVLLPEPSSSADKEALTIISGASIIPLTKGIFPEYRERSLDEEQLDVAAWSSAEYKKYLSLGAQSEPLRQLLVPQTMALETLVGGSNRNGAISMLRWRAAGLPTNTTTIDVDGSNVDSFLKAAPQAWKDIRTHFAKVGGNRSESLEVAKLKTQFGEAETRKFQENFSRLESEKGRPHQVWIFGLEDGASKAGWINALVSLKAKLKPLGYEAFALGHTPKRKFFTDLEQAKSFARTLKPQAHAQLVEEGPAALILDKNMDVVSVSGKVSKRDLDASTKQRVAGLQQMMDFTNQFSGVKKTGFGSFKAGPHFQFVNYPANWFPPQAKIEQLDDGRLKVSVPPRISVCYAYQGAFAIKNYDQYRYMDAQGVSAINYGMSHKDIEDHLRQLDRAYGLNVISASYDRLTAKYLHLPADLRSLAKQEKSFCPDMDQSEILDNLKSNGVAHYWWD